MVICLLTARSSNGLNILSICFRIGTIMMRKNGNAKEKADDLTAHSMARAIICTAVKMCIFQEGTRRTNGTCG